MKPIILSIVLALGFAVAYTRGEDTKPVPAPATTQAAAPVNKKCPISGDDVDPKGKTVTYKKKVIGFCCDDCIAPFNKDPDKYMKNLK